ncbi:MAG: SMI1/KNR4 family protein [Polyangiaceae bacterium]|nr:SMI1/KNR4 family protein [Polyangiaceae bacterium]
MASILEELRADPSVVLLPVTGLPQLRRGHFLPDELRAFYSSCGGLELARDSSYAMRVVTPAEFVSANLEIVGEDVPDDISDSWYLLCRGAGDQVLTIDCSRERLGRCYDSYWEVHGVVGSCAVVAQSFGQLLALLVNAAGHSPRLMKLPAPVSKVVATSASAGCRAAAPTSIAAARRSEQCEESTHPCHPATPSHSIRLREIRELLPPAAPRMNGGQRPEWYLEETPVRSRR